MVLTLELLVLLLAVGGVVRTHALDDGLARTPPMVRAVWR